MGSVKKNRKRRKRRKIKNNNKKAQCQVSANDTFSLDTANTGHYRKKKFKSAVPFVSAGCIIKQESAVKKVLPPKRQLKKRYKADNSIAFVPASCIIKPPPVEIKANISKTDLKKNLTPNIYGPYLKDRKRYKLSKNSGSFVPPSCIINQPQTVTAKVNKTSKFITPPIINTTHIIYGPEANKKRRKKPGGIVNFVPISCTAGIKDTHTDAEKRPACHMLTEQQLSPPITEPKGILKRNKKAFGDNNEIVPPSCIIKKENSQPKKTINTWQLKIPKAVLSEKPADIVGPTPKIRRVKKHHTSAFVSDTCIVREKLFEVIENNAAHNREDKSGRNKPQKIIEKRLNEPTDKQAAVEALIRGTPENEKNRLMPAKLNNIYLIAALIIIAVVIAIFNLSK